MIVIGGGIAGASVAYELAADRSVCLLEMEASLAFHTTGRSAATFLESYGGAIIRRITVSSRAFFENPPEGFDGPLMSPRPLLWLGATDEIRALHAEVSPLVPSVRVIDAHEAMQMNPILRVDDLEVCMLEPGAKEIDVSALHQGFVRGVRTRGGSIRTSSGVVGLTRSHVGWTAVTRDRSEFCADSVVNAAGAWGDEVAVMAGVKPIGLHPLRRTLFMVSAPDGLDVSQFPLTADVAGTFYVKPEGDSQYLCSPADETPSPPCDAKVDELDVAIAIERIREATLLEARHVRSSWAGLRTFTADRSPVAGYDPDADGFFWLVGQGGYGIQTAPALARVAAALVRHDPLPDDVTILGLLASDMHRDRLSGRTELVGH